MILELMKFVSVIKDVIVGNLIEWEKEFFQCLLLVVFMAWYLVVI